jgi:6-phosphogluconolactonase/glucosamine-6-phosphate isomerase/deaminase
MIIASGSNKAEIIYATINSPVSEKIPSTVIQNHSNGFLWIDIEAGSLLY